MTAKVQPLDSHRQAHIEEIRAAAEKVFRTSQAVDAFLSLRSPVLGDTPLALAESGRTAEVLAFLEKLEREAPPPPPTIFGFFSGWLGRFGRR